MCGYRAAMDVYPLVMCSHCGQTRSKRMSKEWTIAHEIDETRYELRTALCESCNALAEDAGLNRHMLDRIAMDISALHASRRVSSSAENEDLLPEEETLRRNY